MRRLHQEKGTREQEREQLLTRLYARSAALVDADSGRVLLGKEEHVMRPMASTTKIMTCILALEKGNPKDLVTASANAAAQPKVHLGNARRGSVLSGGSSIFPDAGIP